MSDEPEASAPVVEADATSPPPAEPVQSLDIDTAAAAQLSVEAAAASSRSTKSSSRKKKKSPRVELDADGNPIEVPPPAPIDEAQLNADGVVANPDGAAEFNPDAAALDVDGSQSHRSQRSARKSATNSAMPSARSTHSVYSNQVIDQAPVPPAPADGEGATLTQVFAKPKKTRAKSPTPAPPPPPAVPQVSEEDKAAQEALALQRAHEAAERVARRKRDEDARKRIAEMARSEAIRQQLAEKERERLKLEEEIQRVKAEQMKERQALREIREQRRRDEEAEAAERTRMSRIKAENHVPLHIKMSQEFEQKFVLPEMQKRSEVLTRIHDLRKPLSAEEMRAHELACIQRKEKADREKAEQLKAARADWLRRSAPHFHGSAMAQAMEEDERAKEAARVKQEELKELWQKKRGYGNLVREMYQPRVDPKKQMEIQRRLQQLHPLKPVVDESMRRPNGGRPPPRSSLPPPKTSPAIPREPSPRQGTKSADGIRRPLPNYLTELHRARAQHNANAVPVEERITKLQQRSKQLETEVSKREDLLARAENTGKRAPDEDSLVTEVSEMYVNMIRAKLQLLHELSHVH